MARLVPFCLVDDADRASPGGILRTTADAYLHLDDPWVTDVALATVVGNALDGDPLWLLLVNPPSSAKTELVQAFSSLDVCAWLPAVSENTFLSGLQKSRRGGRQQSAPEHSLLFRLTDTRLRHGRPPARVLLVQDLTQLITSHRDKRNAIFGQLREIYDGRLTKSTGMGEDLVWEGYLGLLGAVTPKYDEVAELNSVLGERFLLYRPMRIDPTAEARAAAARSEAGEDWRGTLATTARIAFRRAMAGLANVVVPQAAVEQLVDLARLTAVGRAAVERDGHTKVLRVMPEPEGPARLTQQFLKLLRGLCAVRGRTEPGADDLAVVAKAARDSIPKLRLAVLRGLSLEPIERQALADRLGLPPSTVEYYLQDLAAVGAARRSAKRWALADLYHDLASRSGFLGPAVVTTFDPHANEKS